MKENINNHAQAVALARVVANDNVPAEIVTVAETGDIIKVRPITNSANMPIPIAVYIH